MFRELSHPDKVRLESDIDTLVLTCEMSGFLREHREEALEVVIEKMSASPEVYRNVYDYLLGY